MSAMDQWPSARASSLSGSPGDFATLAQQIAAGLLSSLLACCMSKMVQECGLIHDNKERFRFFQFILDSPSPSTL